jgi:C4-dicarboxylate-binding protein DctP
MDGMRRTLRLIVAMAAVLAVSGCTVSAGGGDAVASPDANASAPAPSMDKAGVRPVPTTLRLGTDDVPGAPAVDQIMAFADAVNEISGGQLVIDPVYDANGAQGLGSWDQLVARKVVSGDLDMAVVPARAWDTEGVLSLRALQAPFLVTSDALSASIATSDLAGEMLAGLAKVGVTGLALAPENIRHLLWYGPAPQSLDEFDGLPIRSPRSATSYALLEALGAKPDDFTGTESFDDIVASGRPAAAESALALAGRLPGGTTVIGNLPLFPKVNSLVINTKVFERLSESQQDWLRAAAKQMVAFATSDMPDTTGYAETYCRNSGTIVLADDAFLSDVRRAAQPVYDDLERDPTTKSLIEQIRALAEQIGAHPAEVAACSPADTTPLPTQASTTTGSGVFPEGIYRKDVSVQELLDAGVDRPTAYNHAGTWTLNFRDGDFAAPDCPNSTYVVADGRITVTLGPSGDGCGDAAGKVLFNAGWTLTGNVLQFTDVRSGHGSDLLIETLFGGRPYMKIG